MAKYTSPLFGSMNFTPFSPAPLDLSVFQNINRAGAIKKNADGRIYEADTFINMTYHALGARSDYGLQAYNIAMQYHLTSTADRPLAWFAFPAFYGNERYTAKGSREEKKAWAIKTFHENPCFYYFLIGRTGGASITRTLTNKIGNSYLYQVFRIASVSTKGNYDYAQIPIDTERTVVTQSSSTLTDSVAQVIGTNTLDSLLDNLTQWNGNTSAGRRYYGYTQEYGYCNESDLVRYSALLGQWKLRENNHVNMIGVYTGGVILRTPGAGPLIGSNIISGFPVFTLDSFSQMINYFEDGEWVSDNGEPPPSDWSTDWDIYVKGAQKPSIYITMKSDKVDEWLGKLDDNTSGIEKGDISVEYRYERWEPPSGAQPAPVNILYPSKLENALLLAKDKYNDTRETDYMSNIELNYELVTEIVFANEFRDPGAIQYQYYAQLEFRLKWNKYRSSWCRYAVGYIGSPSILDFDKMNNVGEMIADQDLLDSSTVTLHYDEYPPGFDPYPDTPVPDLPPIGSGDTDPTPVPPGLNGLGLLTETYKISASTAEALGRFFWGGDLFQKIKALNTSPIENVVGLITMPIDIAGSTSEIIIGDVDTNLNGDKITQVPLYELGSIELKGRYESFLDFEPFTSAFIYLPFVGFVRINPAYFTNKTLKVVYSYDIVCGLCNAMLFADGIFIESHQGHCGINIPLIATNRADLQIGLASSLLETGASVATAGAVTGKTAASAGIDVVNAAANYATGFHSSRQTGYSPSCIWGETRNCFLVIESANAAHSSTYNHDRGRPTLASANLGTLRGYTEIDAGVDLSAIGQASEEEKNMIRSILASGFYA